MPRGKKTCPNCSHETGPRAYCCPSCNHVFVFKPKSKEAKNTKIIHKVDWKELVKGDKIKVAGGPFYLHRGEFIPMGYRGRFIVEGIDESGIKAWGLDKHTGFCHIYMGGDFQNPETGVWKTKHKLMKLKNKQETNV